MRAGETVANRFRIERKASSGGMGTVFRALDLMSGEPVALKVLRTEDPDDALRFEHEAAVLSELRHAGIVHFIAQGKTVADERFIAMEWLDGQDLADRLETGPLSVGDSLLLVQHVADALAHAHAAGVVHRDINPTNLFLQDGLIEQVKIIDFGIARSTHHRRVVTSAGTLVGTPGYMSPEQARGDSHVDARVDVFALGCVLFQCLTGKPPFQGEHVVAVLAKTLLEETPRVSDLAAGIPRVLDGLMAKMLAKDPAERLADAAAVVTEIDGLEDVPRSSIAAGSMRISRPALTLSEQRVLCVVLTGRLEIGVRTWRVSEGPEVEAALSVADLFGGKAERLAGGALLVTISGLGTPRDLAAQAARCALGLREVRPGVPMVLSTGRGMLAAKIPVGEVIDRAVSDLSHAVDGMIRLDDATAGLLDGRFEVTHDDTGLYLRRERDEFDAMRTLLGKSTPFVGRERELSELEATFSECVTEPTARAVVVTGQAGFGKSRLVSELLRRIRERTSALTVLPARGEVLAAGSPFGLLAAAIRRCAGILDGDPAPAHNKYKKLRMRVERHVLAAAVERVSEFLGELAGVPLPDMGSVELRAARRDPVLMGDQMRAAWIEFLVAESAAQPVVIVLEDLQWGDLPTVSFVSAALKALPDAPLLVIVTAHPEVKDRFPDLWADCGAQEVKLGALSGRASARLVREALGDDAREALVAQIVERAQGNAFFLEELLRQVAAGGDRKLPETVLAMVQVRLNALEPETRRVLRAASIFGQTFLRGGVIALLDSDAEAMDVDKSLSDLAEREIILPLGAGARPGETEHAFRHSVVREAAYAMLTGADRMLGHKLAGAWLEETGEADAMVLAEHFDRGAEAPRAAYWYRRAAEHALEGNDFAAALARSTRGVDLGASGETLGALRLVQAMACRWRGEFSHALARSAEAARAFKRGSMGWFGSVAEAIGAGMALARFDEVEAWANEASAAKPAAEAKVAQTLCLCRAAGALIAADRHALARRVMNQVETLAGGEALDLGAMAWVYRMRATRAIQAGDMGEYAAALAAACDAFGRAGDRRSECAQRNNLGFAFAELGSWVRAEEELREALAAATRMGLGAAAAGARHNLGYVLAMQGGSAARLAEARALEESAREAFEAYGNPRMAGASTIYLAYIAFAAGELDRAERDARAALATVAAVPPLRPHALAVLARVRLAQGKPQEALSLAREAMTLLGSIGRPEGGEVLIRLVLAQALEAVGQCEAAREVIARAGEALLVRAAKIVDTASRESFLTRVPDNALTLTFARRLGALVGR